MAFRAAGVNLIPGSMGAPGALYYTSMDDTLATIKGAAYFTKATQDASTADTKTADRKAQKAIEDAVVISRRGAIGDRSKSGIITHVQASNGIDTLLMVSTGAGLHLNTGAAYSTKT